MKKIKLLSIMALTIGLAFSSVVPTFAAATVSKSTPYGTLTGTIGGGVSSFYGGKYCAGTTTIGQPVSRIVFSVISKKTSTGATVGTGDRFSNTNARTTGGTYELGGYSNTKITFYGTHDAIHTNGYAVYTSTAY